MRALLWKIQDRLRDESGITTVEVLLLIVVLVAIVLIFKEQITDLVENLMDKITKQAMRV